MDLEENYFKIKLSKNFSNGKTGFWKIGYYDINIQIRVRWI